MVQVKSPSVSVILAPARAGSGPLNAGIGAARRLILVNSEKYDLIIMFTNGSIGLSRTLELPRVSLRKSIEST
jgi:hypothetical protein